MAELASSQTLSTQQICDKLCVGITRPNRENWVEEVKEYFPGNAKVIQNLLVFSEQIGCARSALNGYRRRMDLQIQEFRNMAVWAGLVLGALSGGVLIQRGLPYLGAAVAGIGPLYLLGAALRIATYYQMQRAELQELRMGEAAIAGESEAFLKKCPDSSWSLPNNLFEGCDLQASLAKAEARSLWSALQPKIRQFQDVLAAVNLIGALFEVGGFHGVGRLVSAIRLAGIVSLLSSYGIKGVYDQEVSTWDRLGHAACFAAILAIMGCTCYQKVTGTTFGDYQMAWMVISRGEYYSYLVYKAAGATLSCVSVWRSRQTEIEADLEKSVIRRDTCTFSPPHQESLESYCESRASVRAATIGMVRSLFELLRPGLGLVSLIERDAGVYSALRLGEGLLGIAPFLWRSYESNWIQQDIERQVVKYEERAMEKVKKQGREPQERRTPPSPITLPDRD